MITPFLRRLRLAEALLRFSSGVSWNQLAFREIVIVMAKIYIFELTRGKFYRNEIVNFLVFFFFFVVNHCNLLAIYYFVTFELE